MLGFGAVGALAFAAYAACLIALIGSQPDFFGAGVTFAWTLDGQNERIASVAAAGALCLLGAALPFSVLFTFQKTTAAEAFFIAGFGLSLCAEGLRAAVPLFAAGGSLLEYGAFVTRAAYFGRFFGALCLFTASVYAHGAQQKKVGSLLAALLLGSAFLASQIPINNGQPLKYLVYPVGYQDSILAAYLFISFLTALNFIIAWFAKGMREYLSIALAVVLAIGGRELLFWLPHPAAAAAGALLLAGGILYYSRKTHAIYFWA